MKKLHQSLEAKIFKIKDLYYNALYDSQKGWYKGNDNATPFIKYLLSIVEMAYEDFEDRVKLISEKLSAYELVDNAVKRKLGKITKSVIAELCPSLSISAIEKVMAKMVKEGKLEKGGSSRTTYYIIKI